MHFSTLSKKFLLLYVHMYDSVLTIIYLPHDELG